MANDLDAYKSEQQKQLEAQKARAQESAYINHQKLLKYLEQSSASKGYSVGMTESAKIAAANQYSQDVAAADAAYNQGMGELNHYLRTEQERLDDKAKAEQKAAQDAAYNRVLSLINDGYYNKAEDIKVYIDQLGEGTVSEEQKNDLLYRYGVIAADPNQQAAEVAHQQAETAQNWANMSVEDARAQFGGAHVGGTTYTASGIGKNRKHGDNFTIKDSNGESYPVQLAQKIVETDTYNTGTEQQIGMIQHFNRLGVEDGGVFTVNGHVYIKLGTDYYEVENRPLSGDFLFNEFLYKLSGGNNGQIAEWRK